MNGGDGQNAFLSGDCHIVGPQKIANENVVPVDGDFHIKVYFHVISKDDGSARFPDSGIKELKAALDENFTPHGIYFHYDCDIRDIKNTELYDITIRWVSYNDFWEDVESYIEEDGINIFLKLTTGILKEGTDGLAGGIGKNYFIIEADLENINGYPWESMIQHQMGHCLGLYHTAYGSGRNENVFYTIENGVTSLELLEYYWGKEYLGDTTHYNPLPKAERVDGSNGDVAGDYVADTDASFICLELFHFGDDCEMKLYKLDDFPQGLPTWNKTNASICGSVEKDFYTYITDPIGDYYYVYNNSIRDNVLHNFMSQVPKQSCRNHFTQGQADRMRYLLENHDTLRNIQMTEEDYDLYCDCDHKESGIIDIYEDTIFDVDLWIKKDIVVHGGAILTVSAKLEFVPGTAIYVEREGTLLLHGGTLTAACPDKLWKGIYVQGNIKLLQPSRDTIMDGSGEYAGRVITKRNVMKKSNAVISFAEIGIYTHDNRLTWPEYEEYWGGVIYSKNTEFINDKRSIAFMLYGDYSNQQYENKSSFVACAFKGKDGIKPETGITVWGTYGITIENCEFYDHTRYAISGINYGVKITGDNDFTRNRIAINQENTAPFQGEMIIEAVEERRNIFDNNTADIIIKATSRIHDLKITGNDFKRDNSFIPLGSSGIFIEGPSNFEIKGNSFHNVLRSFQMKNTGSRSNKFKCNTITYNRNNNSTFYTPIGILARGDNRSFEFLYNHFNIAGTCTPDVRLQATKQDQKVVNHEIGKPGFPAGNCFTNYNGRLEIETVGETAIFEYYIPTVGDDRYQCYYPDTSGQRYITEDSNNRINFSECNGGNSEIGYLSNSTGTNLNDNEASLRDSLENYWTSKQYSEVKDIFKNMNNIEGSRMLYGVHIALGDLDSAALLLNSIPVNSLDDLYFKQIQNLYLNRMNNISWPISWNTQEKDLLTFVAESDELSAAYAQSLLSWGGEELSVEIEKISCNQAEPRSVIEKIEKEFTIYPNPAFDKLRIDSDNEIVFSEWKIFDMNGKEIITGASLDLDNSINIQNISSGTYILVLKDNDNEVFFKKFIKQ